jgi:hypothetical protein
MAMKYHFHCDWCDKIKPEGDDALGWCNIQFAVDYEMEMYDMCPECKALYMSEGQGFFNPLGTESKTLLQSKGRVAPLASLDPEETGSTYRKTNEYQGIFNAILTKVMLEEMEQEPEETPPGEDTETPPVNENDEETEDPTDEGDEGAEDPINKGGEGIGEDEEDGELPAEDEGDVDPIEEDDDGGELPEKK